MWFKADKMKKITDAIMEFCFFCRSKLLMVPNGSEYGRNFLSPFEWSCIRELFKF